MRCPRARTNKLREQVSVLTLVMIGMAPSRGWPATAECRTRFSVVVVRRPSLVGLALKVRILRRMLALPRIHLRRTCNGHSASRIVRPSFAPAARISGVDPSSCWIQREVALALRTTMPLQCGIRVRPLLRCNPLVIERACAPCQGQSMTDECVHRPGGFHRNGNCSKLGMALVYTDDVW